MKVQIIPEVVISLTTIKMALTRSIILNRLGTTILVNGGPWGNRAHYRKFYFYIKLSSFYKKYSMDNDCPLIIDNYSEYRDYIQHTIDTFYNSKILWYEIVNSNDFHNKVCSIVKPYMVVDKNHFAKYKLVN